MITYDPISYHISINHPDIIHHLYIFCSGHHHESYDTDYILYTYEYTYEYPYIV